MEVTTSGRPPIISREWFRTRYGQSVADWLCEEMCEFIDTCIEDVYTVVYGVGELWEHRPRKEYIQLLYKNRENHSFLHQANQESSDHILF